MGNSKKPRRGRAHRASADALFERALLGGRSLEESSGSRRFNPREDRKTLQLCRQVQRAIGMALPGDGGDEALIDASVDSVEPMGGPGQMLVRVSIPADADASPAEVTARLAAQAPRLRAVVASQISRKRVPALAFVVVPMGEAPSPSDEPPTRGTAPTPRQSVARNERSAAADLPSGPEPIRAGAGSQSSPALPRRGGERDADEH